MADWLPPLCLFEEFGNQWERYEQQLYAFFRRDFVVHPPRIGRETVRINVAPVVNGKEESFWHLITEEETIARESRVERVRVPQFRRCERICWPGAILREGKAPVSVRGRNGVRTGCGSSMRCRTSATWFR